MNTFCSKLPLIGYLNEKDVKELCFDSLYDNLEKFFPFLKESLVSFSQVNYEFHIKKKTMCFYLG